MIMIRKVVIAGVALGVIVAFAAVSQPVQRLRPCIGQGPRPW
jgi:hypothetical protein